MKNEIQTGTKVLIEATVEMTDGKDDTTLVRFKTSGCYWMDTSDLTVFETAEKEPKSWKVHRSDPDFEKVGEALKFEHNKWLTSDAVGKDGNKIWHNYVDDDDDTPTISGQQALKLLGVEPQQIDLNNFAIDITDPVNAELLPGFKVWLGNQKPGNIIQGNWRHPYYGMQYSKTAVWYDSEKNVCEKLLTTLPELQNQHPGVFNQSDSEPTPSFKAGQEVWKPEDSCEWDMPQPNKNNIIKGNGIIQAICGGMAWVNDQEGDFHTIPLEELRRPIPAQPTVESEILAVLEKCAGGQCGQKFTLTTESGLLQILDIFNRHQKHSGRVEVSVPSDDEIEKDGKERGLRDNELQLWWEGAVWMRNFITRKEQQG